MRPNGAKMKSKPNKITTSVCMSEVLLDSIKEFADTVSLSKSELLSLVMEKFLHSNEKSVKIEKATEYVDTVNNQQSYYCPTRMGTMMTFNFSMDFVVEEELED